jgi:hypothetical protein
MGQNLRFFPNDFSLKDTRRGSLTHPCEQLYSCFKDALSKPFRRSLRFLPNDLPLKVNLGIL